jgi:dienelactone hydrolase
MIIRTMLRTLMLPLSMAIGAIAAPAQDIKGSVLDASPGNLALTWRKANIVLPPALTGGPGWQGAIEQMPAVAASRRSPLAIVMHGSSGVAGFVKEYQAWLAQELGLPSIAPDSLAIPERLTYTSPIDKPTYERVHALRLAELDNALTQARALPWVDPDRIVVIGTSEGAVPVARLGDARPFARIMYAWSCEANYFVEAPRTAIPKETPTLALIAVKDPYFSPDNPWNKGYDVKGTCAGALKEHAQALVATLSTDKHTIVNLAEARDVAKVFLQRALAGGAKAP